MRTQKAQSTVEYILLVTAVVALVILFTNPTQGLFSQRVNQVFNETSMDMLNVASILQTNAATSSGTSSGGITPQAPPPAEVCNSAGVCTTG